VTVVGITLGSTERPEVVTAFVRSVLAAGATPVLIPTSMAATDMVDEALHAVDALLLSGGGDVHPSEYGQAPRTTLDAVDRQRDRMERRAVDAALRQRKRILGVCRGAQLMCVATGGTLVQDLTAEGLGGHIDESHDRGYATLVHGVKSEAGSTADCVLDGLDAVNSHHHQAIRDVGDVLTATAWAEDGVIEAVEAPGMLGLQWHPEVLVDTDHRHLEPFRWLVTGNGGRD
jgi:putative glutamine amidotransferase